MIATIIFIILLLIAVGAFVFGADIGERTVGVIPLIIGLVVMLFACSAIVPTRQVGIPVTFGKPGTPMSNGYHLKAPWTKVEKMDGTIQIDDNLGERRTEIRLSNQSVAFVQNNVRWSIRTEKASELYAAHKSFDKIGPALEEQALASALNEAFKNYDPLSQDKPSLDSIAQKVKTRLEEKIGDRIIIHDVTIPKVDFDEKTQARIDAYQQEIGNTRIAEQRKKTAALEAESNKVLADSVSKDPNVLVSKCLDLLNEGRQVPAGFQCWPGNGQGVIVGGGK